MILNQTMLAIEEEIDATWPFTQTFQGSVSKPFRGAGWLRISVTLVTLNVLRVEVTHHRFHLEDSEEPEHAEQYFSGNFQ